MSAYRPPYEPWIRLGNLLFLSGHIARRGELGYTHTVFGVARLPYGACVEIEPSFAFETPVG
jgi:hypothetical protein